MLVAEGNNAAQAAGAVTFYILFAALIAWLIVSGNQQVKATQGEQGKVKRVVGWILLVFLVGGVLGQLGQQS
jgi:hydrogenase/urease accessory protein HupE